MTATENRGFFQKLCNTLSQVLQEAWDYTIEAELREQRLVHESQHTQHRTPWCQFCLAATASEPRPSASSAAVCASTRGREEERRYGQHTPAQRGYDEPD